MGEFSGYLICSDIDGTLTYETGKVSAKNLDAINRFISGGGLFTLASGRDPSFSRSLPAPINAPIISSNGAAIIDTETDTRIYETFLNEKVIAAAGDIYGKFAGLCERMRFVLRDSLQPSTISEAPEYLFGLKEILKIAFHTQTEADAELIRNYAKEKFPDINVVLGWEKGVELNNGDTSKGNGVEFLKKYYGDRVKTTVCVGNYENDVSMFSAADISFAIEGSPEGVLNKAKYVAPKNTEDAIAYIIDNLKNF